MDKPNYAAAFGLLHDTCAVTLNDGQHNPVTHTFPCRIRELTKEEQLEHTINSGKAFVLPGLDFDPEEVSITWQGMLYVPGRYSPMRTIGRGELVTLYCAAIRRVG